MPWVVGALGSRPARSKGIGRPSAGGREPKGKRHAVDLATGLVACGAHDSLRIFDDLAVGARGRLVPGLRGDRPSSRASVAVA